jgi:hypothetical protein
MLLAGKKRVGQVGWVDCDDMGVYGQTMMGRACIRSLTRGRWQWQPSRLLECR